MKNSIISYFHLLENIVLKIPLFKFIILKSENLIYNILIKKNIENLIEKTIEHNQALFNHYLETLKKYEENFSFKDKIILEIGPGNNMILAFIFILNGAKKVYLIDRYKHIYNDYFNHRLFSKYINDYRKDLNSKTEDYNQVKKRIFYYGNNSIEKINKIAENSIDFIFSHAVLEHVFNLDLTFKKIHQLLRKASYSMHMIDLRDHFHIRNKCYLDFLKYSDKLWRIIGDTNRIRFGQYKEYIEKYNFKIVNIRLQKMGPKQRIEKIKNKFVQPYKNLNIDELSVRGFYLIIQKD